MSNLIAAIERESINSFKLIKSKKEIIGMSVIVTNADNLLNFVFQNVRDEDTGVLSYIKSINASTISKNSKDRIKSILTK